MPRGIKDKVVILGMGCSRFGERWDCNAEDLIVEAAQECFADAGVGRERIDAAWLATAIEEQHMGKSGIPLALALRLPFIPVTRVENYCASGTEAFRGAVYAVAAGAADIAMARRRRETQGYRLRRVAAAQPRHSQRHVLGQCFGARLVRAARDRLFGQARARDAGAEKGDGAGVGKEPRKRLAQSQGAPAQPDRYRDRAEGSDDRRAARAFMTVAAYPTGRGARS